LQLCPFETPCPSLSGIGIGRPNISAPIDFSSFLQLNARTTGFWRVAFAVRVVYIHRYRLNLPTVVAERMFARPAGNAVASLPAFVEGSKQTE
jgi:hypothetical protein